MKLKRLRFISVGSSVVLTGLLILAAGTALRSRAQNSSPMAFTALYQTNSKATETGAAISVRYLEARRSDGSKMETIPENRFSMRRVILTSTQQEVQLADALALKSTLDYSVAVSAAKSGAAVGVQVPRQNQCAPLEAARAESLGGQDIAGVASFGYRTTNVEPDGHVETVEMWYAPQLSCFAVLVNSKLKDSGGAVVGVFERRTLSITPGEPDSKLFEIPAAYAEVRPSVLLKKLALERLSAEDASAERKSEVVEKMAAYWDREDRKYAKFAPRPNP